MHSRPFAISLAALGCIIVALSAFAQPSDSPVKDKGTLKVPAKEVPAPASVSPELRAAIAARPIPPYTPAPKTADEWRKLQRTCDAVEAKQARDVAKAVGAKSETQIIGGVRCYLITPKDVSAENQDRLLVHVHGGAFVFGGGEAATGEAVLVAHACKARVLSVDYRRPPDHPFPAAIDDAVAVWKQVIKKHDAAETALFGSSAGGNLTLTTVLRLKELKLPLPGALFVGTPASDLTKTGDTWFTNVGLDALGRYDGLVAGALKLYAGGRDMKAPLLSPIHGDLADFPPTILISGTRDLLLSDTVRIHRKLRQAGVQAELHVFEGQGHGAYLWAYRAPEAQDALNEISQFFNRHLASQSPAFKVIEVQQTGGFAGVNITYRITPDGKFTRKSKRGTAEGKLDPKEATALSKAVAAIDWEKMPAKLRDPKVADDFIYDMHFVIGKKTHRVTADGTSAGKNALLKPILMTLVKIQRVPVKKD